MQKMITKLAQKAYIIKIIVDNKVEILHNAKGHKIAYFIDETATNEYILQDILSNNEVRVFKISKQQLEELK